MTAVMLRLLWKQYFENGAKRYSGVVSDSSLVLLFTKKIKKNCSPKFHRRSCQKNNQYFSFFFVPPVRELK